MSQQAELSVRMGLTPQTAALAEELKALLGRLQAGPKDILADLQGQLEQLLTKLTCSEVVPLDEPNCIGLVWIEIPGLEGLLRAARRAVQWDEVGLSQGDPC